MILTHFHLIVKFPYSMYSYPYYTILAGGASSVEWVLRHCRYMPPDKTRLPVVVLGLVCAFATGALKRAIASKIIYVQDE